MMDRTLARMYDSTLASVLACSTVAVVDEVVRICVSAFRYEATRQDARREPARFCND